MQSRHASRDVQAYIQRQQLSSAGLGDNSNGGSNDAEHDDDEERQIGHLCRRIGAHVASVRILALQVDGLAEEASLSADDFALERPLLLAGQLLALAQVAEGGNSAPVRLDVLLEVQGADNTDEELAQRPRCEGQNEGGRQGRKQVSNVRVVRAISRANAPASAACSRSTRFFVAALAALMRA